MISRSTWRYLPVLACLFILACNTTQPRRITLADIDAPTVNGNSNELARPDSYGYIRSIYTVYLNDATLDDRTRS